MVKALLTTAEACQHLSVSRSTLFNLSRDGLIRRFKLSARLIRWPVKELDRLIQKRTAKAR